MRALVVYESMFGNTRSVAVAIASGLGCRYHVECVEVGSAPTTLAGFDLVAVGGPTHAFGMTRASTRSDAENQADAPLVSRDGGIREWLDELSDDLPPAACAFDTRVHRPRLPGSAARAAGRVLRRLGVPLVVASESFWVDGVRGPLIDGELARAEQWATVVATQLTGAAAEPHPEVRPGG